VGARTTLVDAGMRGHWPQLTDALGALGRKVEAVEAVVLTHAHADHVGFAHQVKANSDATVWVHERDAEPGLRRFPPFRLFLRPTAWPLLAHGPYRRRRGPRLLIRGVNEDNEQARTSLDALAEPSAQLLLPGHGEPWRDGVAAAVADTRRRGHW
jgi:glyoxylase-like metal-dependent hydrolase (beta-lactamase superfamily II)